MSSGGGVAIRNIKAWCYFYRWSRMKKVWGSRKGFGHSKKGNFPAVRCGTKSILNSSKKKVSGPHNFRCEMEFSAEKYMISHTWMLFFLEDGWEWNSDNRDGNHKKRDISTLKHKRIKWKWQKFIWFESGRRLSYSRWPARSCDGWNSPEAVSVETCDIKFLFCHR